MQITFGEEKSLQGMIPSLGLPIGTRDLLEPTPISASERKPLIQSCFTGNKCQLDSQCGRTVNFEGSGRCIRTSLNPKKDG